MVNRPILDAETLDWTYEDVATELEQLAMLEDLEPPSGPSLSDLPSLAFDDEISRASADLDQLADLAEL